MNLKFDSAWKCFVSAFCFLICVGPFANLFVHPFGYTFPLLLLLLALGFCVSVSFSHRFLGHTRKPPYRRFPTAPTELSLVSTWAEDESANLVLWSSQLWFFQLFDTFYCHFVCANVWECVGVCAYVHRILAIIYVSMQCLWCFFLTTCTGCGIFWLVLRFNCVLRMLHTAEATVHIV